MQENQDPTLPSDIPSLRRDEIESSLREWAAEAREQFENRRAFNQEICTRLAKAGLQPTAAAVLRVGRWGQTTSIATDVDDWYAQIGQRLAARDALVPPAVQAQANQLIESLWRLATVETDQRLAEPLRQEIVALTGRLAQAGQVQLDLQGQLVELGDKLDEARIAARTTREALDAEQAKHAETQSVLASLEKQIGDLRLAHSNALANQAADHARAADEVRAQAQQREGELLAQLTSLRVEHQAETTSLRAEHQAQHEAMLRSLDDARAQIMGQTQRAQELQTQLQAAQVESALEKGRTATHAQTLSTQIQQLTAELQQTRRAQADLVDQKDQLALEAAARIRGLLENMIDTGLLARDQVMARARRPAAVTQAEWDYLKELAKEGPDRAT